MVPIFISNALVSDGFNNAPALRQQANGEVLFNVGHRIPGPPAPAAGSTLKSPYLRLLSHSSTN